MAPSPPKRRGKSKPPVMKASSSPYHQAASMLNEVWTRRVSLKSLAFAKTTTATTATTATSSNGGIGGGGGGGGGGDGASDSASGGLLCSKTAYAQASNVLQCREALDAVVHRRQSSLGGAGNRGLLYVLLYELLAGPNRAIRGGGALKRMLLKIEPDLRRDWEELRKDRHCGGGTSRTPREGEEEEGEIDADGPDVREGSGGVSRMACHHPRYVRVNTLATTTPSIMKRLDDLGILWRRDEHVPDLLVLPARDAETTKHLVDMGRGVIMQDKSSCLPALCLVHGYGSSLVEGADYMDACAAPGNKTLQLAALVAAATATATATAASSTSVAAEARPATIHAFDKDTRRCRDLARRVDEHMKGCSPLLVRVKVECRDFLSLPPGSYPTVGAILLDPTCSGSGTRAGPGHERIRADNKNDDDDEADPRLRSLSRFQLAALRHAMAFPHCQRIVYSTCSIYELENEHVVAAALNAEDDRDHPSQNAWTIVPPRCLEGWTRRGRVVGGLTPEQASALIRVDPNKDGTGGFFVACLERRPKADPSCPPLAATKKRSSGGSDPLNGATDTAKRPKRSRASEAKADRAEPRNDADSIEPKGAADGSPNAAALTKKRLKKLQWKRRQREEKERRLKSHKLTTSS